MTGRPEGVPNKDVSELLGVGGSGSRGRSATRGTTTPSGEGGLPLQYFREEEEEDEETRLHATRQWLPNNHPSAIEDATAPSAEGAVSPPRAKPARTHTHKKPPPARAVRFEYPDSDHERNSRPTRLAREGSSSMPSLRLRDRITWGEWAITGRYD